jgi:hypothetical protein
LCRVSLSKRQAIAAIGASSMPPLFRYLVGPWK